MKAHEPTERRTGHLFLLIFLLLAAGIVAAGTFYYRNHERHYRAEVESQLSSIAELKVAELVQWRKERLGDGLILFKNTAFSSLVRRFYEKPEDSGVQRQLQAWLEKYQTANQYAQIRLLDVQGETRMEVPTGRASMSSVVSKRISEVLRSGQVTFQDFYRNEHDQRVYLAVLVPILDEAAAGKPLGVIVLRIDPTTYLYPFISQWPTTSRTAETLIVRRDGKDVLFLNELRFQTNTALNLRRSLENTNIPAAKAALGQEGIMEGKDYRGAPVVAALRTIPDSPWFLVARMDTAEVYAPMREWLWQVVVLVAVLLFGAGASVGLVWRHQRVDFYRERYETEEMLRRSEEKYRELFQNAQVGMYRSKLDGSAILAVNRKLCEIFGYSEEEIIGNPATIRWGDAGARERMIAAVKERGSLFDSEIEIVTKSGEVRTCSVSVALFPDLGYLEGSAIDITDRKQVDEALAREQHLMTTLIENIPDAIYFKDAKSRFLRINQCLARQFELSDPAQAVGKTDFDFYSLEHAQAAFNDEQEIIRTGQPVLNLEEMETWPHRLPTWVSTTKMPLRDPTGQIIGTFGLSRNITENKRIEEELRASEERFRRVVIDSPFPILLHAEDGTILQISNSWCEISGYTREELATVADWTERAYGEHRERIQPAIDALYGLDHWKAEGDYRIHTKDGAIRIWNFSSAPLGRLPDGRRLVLSMAKDVTERREAENEVRRLNTELEQRVKDRTSQLEDTNKELEAFSYSVSHDLRAPLRAIDGFARILTEDYTPRLDAEGKRVLDIICAEAKRMGQLIDDLLAFSRLSRQPIRTMEVDMGALAKTVFEECGAQAPGRKLKFKLQPAPPAHGDPVMLRQVLANLIGNAKYTRPKDTAEIEVGGRTGGEESLYYVKDNGVGFDMNYVHKLFGVFQRLHTEAEFEGTGVGLALIQRVIHRHGGRVWAEGKVNEGATFYFTLPKRKE
jgi:PAS domain S-box-containing protein